MINRQAAISAIGTLYGEWFDSRVAEIRKAGIAPKCIRKPKAKCSPMEWAAHREYMRLRHLDPVCRAMHVANQLKYLAKRK